MWGIPRIVLKLFPHDHILINVLGVTFHLLVPILMWILQVEERYKSAKN